MFLFSPAVPAPGTGGELLPWWLQTSCTFFLLTLTHVSFKFGFRVWEEGQDSASKSKLIFPFCDFPPVDCWGGSWFLFHIPGEVTTLSYRHTNQISCYCPSAHILRSDNRNLFLLILEPELPGTDKMVIEARGTESPSWGIWKSGMLRFWEGEW